VERIKNLWSTYHRPSSSILSYPVIFLFTPMPSYLPIILAPLYPSFPLILYILLLLHSFTWYSSSSLVPHPHTTSCPHSCPQNYINAASFSRRLLELPDMNSERNAESRSKVRPLFYDILFAWLYWRLISTLRRLPIAWRHTRSPITPSLTFPHPLFLSHHLLTLSVFTPSIPSL
jgi:hypothetical protein